LLRLQPASNLPNRLLRVLSGLIRRAVRLPGRGAPAFYASLNGVGFRLLVRELGPGRFELVTLEPWREAEFSDGLGHNLAQSQLALALQSLGLQLQQGTKLRPEDRRNPAVFGFNQAQSRLDGTHTNRKFPDVSYVGWHGGQQRRVNVEIDTDPKKTDLHLRNLSRFDPNAVQIGLVIDPATGRVIEQRAYDPRTKKIKTSRVTSNQVLNLPGVQPGGILRLPATPRLVPPPQARPQPAPRPAPVRRASTRPAGRGGPPTVFRQGGRQVRSRRG
jgi:hypothetical protein